MKHLAPIVALCLALAFSACGDDSSPNPGKSDTVATGSRSKAAKPGKPEVEVPPGPPPKELVVTDLRKGSGPVLDDPDDELVVHYVGVTYDTGEEFYSTWDRGGPSKYLLEEVHKGWELGLKGMRVGGRRELIEPSRLAYGTGTLIYVVDLLAVR